MTVTAVKPSPNSETNSTEEVLLLSRTHDTDEEGADQAYVLLSITRQGLENIKTLGAAVTKFNGESDLFSSAQFYMPAGVRAFLLTDPDAETLELLIDNPVAKESIFQMEDEQVKLEIIDLINTKENLVRLAPIDHDTLSSMEREFEPNFTVDSHLLRFYDDEDFYCYFMFKYAAGHYSLDSISVRMLERFFGIESDDEPAEENNS